MSLSQNERIKLRRALTILSGTKRIEDVCHDDLAELGYDPYKFSYYGKPNAAEIREKAEDIVYQAIVQAYHEPLTGGL